ncbi:hypothetical protein, partial [Phocaeicola plebeius]|uniref:hypothetical protein n=1 Tax=Phocaeicola plebeius TaxID=310297 RepID=UPI002943F0A3
AKVGLGNMRVKAENRMVTIFWVVFGVVFWVIALSGYSNLNIVQMPEASQRNSGVEKPSFLQAVMIRSIPFL